MTFYILITIGAWVGALLVFFAVSRAFKSADADKVKNRLLGIQSPSKKTKGKSKKEVSLLQVEDRTTGKLVMKVLRKFELTDRVQQLLEQGGIKVKTARFLHLCLGLFLIGFVASWFSLPTNMRLLALVIGSALGAIPFLYVIRKKNKRISAFEEQFPDSLEFVARSMRAGHGFAVSLEMIHKEFQEPLSSEFRRAFEEHNLGLPLEVALQKLAKRIPILDVGFFVSAVLLQKRTGGNLAEILDKLAYVIRERFKLRGRIRAISAHGRMTGTALSMIPMAVAALMCFVNPPYIEFFLNDETGQLMMGAALGLQLLGYLVINKIVQIEI